MRSLLLLAIGCLVAESAIAATFLVGDTQGDSCDFSGIQDAIDAAAANGFYGNRIVVTNTGTYTDQALRIGDTTVIIEGGYDSCARQLAAAPADIVGNGVDPVFQFAPTLSGQQTLSLRSLHVHGGGSSGVEGSRGGGVYVTNNARLFTFDTVIDGNASSSGGGIYIDGENGSPYVQLNPGTRISGNYASYYGGGIAVAGGRLDIVADDVVVAGNEAASAGGGIAALQGYVSVGNPMTLPARSDARGATITANSAGGIGGGLFVYGPAGALDANELIVDANQAASGGGGIAASTGAHVTMRRDYANAPLQCPNSRECSRISNNSAGGGATGTVGGAIALYAGAVAEVAQTIIRGNTASAGSAAYVDSSTLLLEGVLATGNTSFVNAYGQNGATLQTAFLDSSKPSVLRVAYSTFDQNLLQPPSGSAGAAVDIGAQKYSQLSVYSTAFYDLAGVAAYSAYTDDCVVESPQGADLFGTHTRLAQTDKPGFNGAARGDFRLRSESALTDYCDSGAFIPGYRDLVLTPRCHDDPRKPDVHGHCDVGAYESDHIFGGSVQ